MKARQSEPEAPKVLMELRPAFDGFAGIPQETRLLFRGLRMLGSVQVMGMLQTSHRILARGTRSSGYFADERWLPESRKINRYSRVVVSAAETPFATIIDKVANAVERRVMSTTLTLGTLFGAGSVRLSVFRPRHFEDFVWRTLFSKTLPASDFDLVTGADLRICSVPWHTMHMVGLNTLTALRTARYQRLDTKGIDVFIGQTPYPARIHKDTAFVIRYHDALPVLMPHTIPDKSLHQATHFYTLWSNVRSGAYFACVSETTRRDLLKIYPKIGHRAVTIHNMVSHHYYLEDSSPERVPGIIRSRLSNLDPNTKDMGLSPDFLSLS